jgi:hypothetical protein
VNGERTPANDHQQKLMVQNNRAVSLLVMVRELGGSAFDLNRAVTVSPLNRGFPPLADSAGKRVVD